MFGLIRCIQLLSILGAPLGAIAAASSISSEKTLDSREYGSYDYGFDTSEFVKRQASDFYPVTGVPTTPALNGSVPVRKEIRDLQQDQDTWTLYILGLDMMQYMDQSNKLSWYQIADPFHGYEGKLIFLIKGIHGCPYLPWDGVQASKGDKNAGYCQHVSIIFLTWHRPYLALYEQVIWGYIQQIAQMYPAGDVRNRYVAAAQNFRIPYWDWAAVPSTGTSVFPQSVSSSAGVAVDGPSGTQTISNPLYSYTFHPLNATELPYGMFSKWPSTLRYPTNTNDPNAQSQNNLVAKQLDNSASSHRQRLYNLFTNSNNYSTWSNEAWMTSNTGQSPVYDSIESVHDDIHAQVINPNSYVTPQAATYDTFTNPAGQIQNAATHLTPFHNDSFGNFWTSKLAKATESFGYAYPETVSSSSTKKQLKQKVITAVNTLYGSQTSAASRLKAREDPEGEQMEQRDTESSTYREWITNIRVPKFALNKTFFVNVFFGDYSSNPFDWSFESNLVGSYCVSATATNTNCPTCLLDQLVSGTIPLTANLNDAVANGNLKSMEPTDVLPYLESNLKWTISLLDDTAVPNADVPNLTMVIVSSVVQKPATVGDLPVWGPQETFLTWDNNNSKGWVG